MAQPQSSRRISSTSRNQTSRSGPIDRTPGRPTGGRARKPSITQQNDQHIHRSRSSNTINAISSSQQPSSSTARRGSIGANSRRPTVQVHTNSVFHSTQHRHTPLLPPQHRPEDFSDAGSISSIPSTTKSLTKEPTSGRSYGTKSKSFYRDDSPVNSKKSIPGTPQQKQSKNSRKVIEGTHTVFLNCSFL